MERAVGWQLLPEQAAMILAAAIKGGRAEHQVDGIFHALRIVAKPGADIGVADGGERFRNDPHPAERGDSIIEVEILPIFRLGAISAGAIESRLAEHRRAVREGGERGLTNEAPAIGRANLPAV